MKQLERVPDAAAPATTGEVPEQTLAIALADLEALTGAQRSEFVVAQGIFQEWPDGGMGCTAPGEIHTQVPVKGYRIIIEYRGSPYDYRVSERGHLRRCEAGRGRDSGAPTR